MWTHSFGNKFRSAYQAGFVSVLKVTVSQSGGVVAL